MKKVNIGAPGFEYDEGDPEGFRAGMFRPGPGLGAAKLGLSVYEIPPGQSLCPYHFEYGEEEWLLVLDGEATVRHPGGEEVLAAWDLTCFPPGPEGAHEVRNDSAETIRILMFSDIVTPTATSYPDSGKIGIWTGDKEDDVMVHRSSKVGYFSGEPRLEQGE
ncbi:MAG: cupin domain-containing protein [Solirubrobacterales bacterium]|nr:cupin domain-containing protein [Solirubrobacterales bacterium]